MQLNSVWVFSFSVQFSLFFENVTCISHFSVFCFSVIPHYLSWFSGKFEIDEKEIYYDSTSHNIEEN